MDLIIREKDELESLDITAISDNWSGISEEQDLPIIQRIILHLIGRNISQDTKINQITSLYYVTKKMVILVIGIY